MTVPPLGRNVGQRLHGCRFLAALLGKVAADLVQRVGEPRLVHRLHQIVDRPGLEGAQGMVRISDEDEEGGSTSIRPWITEKPSKPGIWISRNTKSGLCVLIERSASRAVRAGVDDLNILVRLETELQPLDGERFVVDQDGAYGHFGSSVSI